MVGRTDDQDFLKKRTDTLVKETSEGSREWKREAPGRASTMYNINHPTDGENYNVRMTIMRIGSNGDTRHLLVSHETGSSDSIYKMSSNDYKPLAELGKLVFSK